jgi:aspartate racemase
VVIQPGQPEAKPPLFCLHVLGRGLKFCRPFTRYLDPQQPVYGLSTHIAGEPFECAEVEVLAAHYIKQIEALQPNGPYLLAGVSLGGLIALEVAQQLVAQGQKVALLALLDTQVPGEDASVGASEKLLDHWEQLSEKGLIYVFQKLRDVLVGKTQALTTWLRESYYGVSTEFYQKAGFPLPDYLQDYVYRMQNEQSAASYIPQTYAGQVKLFKATGLDNSEVGWKKLALGGLEVYEMPGTHLGMLSEPHVRVLGETLQSCIAEIISVKQF